MKRLRLFLALFTALVTFGGISAVNAVSASITANDTNNSFTITRTVTGATATVNNTFGYTITADSNNPAGVTGAPTSASVTFNVAPISGTATATGIIDLKGMTFAKNGDYKYTLEEVSSTNSTIYPVDEENTYTIQISVRNAGSNDFSSKVVTITAIDSENNKTTDLAFTSEGVYTYISISKTVDGNMADVDEYFKVRVNINGTEGDTFTIGGQTYDGAGKQNTLVVGQTNFIYLKHGETVTIGKSGNDSEIPLGVTYSFVEQDALEYQTYINGSSTNDKESASLTTAASDNSNDILNTYNTATITGVMMKVAPYMAVFAVVLIIGAYMVIRNKRKILEEE